MRTRSAVVAIVGVVSMLVGVVSSFSTHRPGLVTHVALFPHTQQTAFPQTTIQSRNRIQVSYPKKNERQGGVTTRLDSAVSSHLVSEAFTFATICFLGDLLAQTKEIKKQKQMESSASSSERKLLDWQRTRRFAYKGLGCGVIWSFWYRFAETLTDQLMGTKFLVDMVATSTSGSMYRIMKTIASIFLEQMVACPIIYGLWDLPMLTLLGGKPASAIPREVKSKLPKLLIANAKLWTFVNLLIYNTPLQYRVYALSGAEIIWQSIVSLIASKDGESTEPPLLELAAQK
jgi:hypothetical protein